MLGCHGRMAAFFVTDGMTVGVGAVCLQADNADIACMGAFFFIVFMKTSL